MTNEIVCFWMGKNGKLFPRDKTNGRKKAQTFLLKLTFNNYPRVYDSMVC